jgi:hypothetical protein
MTTPTADLHSPDRSPITHYLSPITNHKRQVFATSRVTSAVHRMKAVHCAAFSEPSFEPASRPQLYRV